MKTKLSVPVLALIGATRGMIGVGAGLLLANKIPASRRNKLAFALIGVGAASTAPLLAAVVRGFRQLRREGVGGVMEPQSQIFQPQYGTVVDADIEEIVPVDEDAVPEVEQAETPNIRP